MSGVGVGGSYSIGDGLLQRLDLLAAGLLAHVEVLQHLGAEIIIINIILYYIISYHCIVYHIILCYIMLYHTI